MSSRASRTKQCPACGTAVWLDPGEIWTKCTSCGRKIHRGEIKDEEWRPPQSGDHPPSTVAPSTVTTPQTRRTIYLLAIVPLVLAIIAGLASYLSHEERAHPKHKGAAPPASSPSSSSSGSPLSDAGAHG